MSDRVTLNAAEVADVLGVSEATVRRQITAGIIPSFRIGKRVLVHRDVLEAWVLDLAQKATAS